MKVYEQSYMIAKGCNINASFAMVIIFVAQNRFITKKYEKKKKHFRNEIFVYNTVKAVRITVMYVCNL